MFTGIIETVGTVAASRAGRLIIRPTHSFRNLSMGESISVDGVCLTVDHVVGGELTFRLLPETTRSTTLGKLRLGDRVNLERSLRMGDHLGGHLLLGHVDGRGTIIGRSERAGTSTVQIQIPHTFVSSLVPKGPIALDGVSLTLDPKIEREKISIHLIPHTVGLTTLGKKRVGSQVNIELDLIAKYLRGMLY